jgi:glycosyltransferase involved in cell wall biosynthesis
MKKPRLLVTTSTLPLFEGDSTPRFVLDLASGLRDHYDITILAPAAPGTALEEYFHGVRVVRYRYAPLRSLEKLASSGGMLPLLKSNPACWLLVPLLVLGLYRATRQQLKSGGFICVHCHWLLPQGIVQALLFRRASDPPFVITCHGSDVFGLNHPIVLPLKRIALRRANAVTVVSNAVKAFLVDKAGSDIDQERIRVVSMGVDLDRFDPSLRDDDWPERYGLTRPVILFVGRLSAVKGTTYLLEALAMEPLRSSTASLAIVGDGPLRATLSAEIEALGIANRVRFLGALDHTQLPVVYASADIFCAPSVEIAGQSREGLPTVLCEAAGSGLAVVASQVGGIPEVVRDGVTGILVESGDSLALARALYNLVDDVGRRATMGQVAHEEIRHFGWDQVSDRFHEVIGQAIAKSTEEVS